MNSMIYYNNDVIMKKRSEITIHESTDSIWSETFENISVQQKITSRLKILNCMK